MTGSTAGGSDLRRRAVRGVAWTTFEALGTRLITTVVFFLLARLLTPEAFGLVALGLVFVALARILVDQGFGATIVQREVLDDEHLDTAFWTSLATGLALAGCLALAAPLLADAFGAPGLAPLLQALSAVIVVGAPSSTAVAVLKRRFGFRSLAQRRLLGAVVGGCAGIAAALLGAGAWALVVQALVQTATSTAVLWFVTPYRPGLRVSRAALRDLVGFSLRVTGMTVVNFASKRADDLLVGGVLGPVALGLYAVAYRLLTVMSEVLSVSVDTVAFPAFSRVQSDVRRLRDTYRTTTRSALALAAPAFLVMAVVAPDLVAVLVGPKWEESVPVMQVLALAGVPQAAQGLNSTLLLGAGRAKAALRLSAANAALNVVGFALAVQLGLVAVAAAFTARALVMAPVAVVPVARLLGMSASSWCRAVAAPLGVAVLTALSAAGVRLLVEDASAPVRLLAVLAAAALAYALCMRFLARRLTAEVLEHARHLRSGRRRGAGRADAPPPREGAGTAPEVADGAPAGPPGLG